MTKSGRDAEFVADIEVDQGRPLPDHVAEDIVEMQITMRPLSAVVAARDLMDSAQFAGGKHQGRSHVRVVPTNHRPQTGPFHLGKDHRRT